ncbi:MAG TPA: hypothetical protein VLK65_28550, partial [Vicinamibacteria bacterium]|nr:hypothetical protein [Vicinamibacteria bacterium]
ATALRLRCYRRPIIAQHRAFTNSQTLVSSTKFSSSPSTSTIQMPICIPIDATFAPAYQGDYTRARGEVRRSEELDPTSFFPPFAYGWIEIQFGKTREAIPHFQKSKSMGSPPFVNAYLAYAYGASGDRARALAELEELKKLSLGGSPTAFNLAVASLGLGEHGRAVSYLEQAYASDSEWLGWLVRDRMFDPLRSDPRFVTLMKKLGFEE